jgi:signal transduction histidine kinase
VEECIVKPFLSLWHLTDKFRQIWAATSQENNRDYRESYLASDTSQVRLIIFFVILLLVGFILGDYLFLGFSFLFTVILLLRLFLIVYSALQIRYLWRVQDFRAYDKSVFIYMLVLFLGILIVDASRPENFAIHIIIVNTAVFVCYLIVPTRFIYQAVPSLLFSACETILITLTFNGLMDQALVTALVSMVFVNVVAALSSLQLHSYRWRIYQTAAERKETDRLAAIGQTAGMIGHDIRNPLQAIVSELYIAKEAIAESPAPKEAKAPAEESINIIEEQTDYISKIVSDLQDFARPIRPEFKEVDLAKVVASVFQTLRIPDGVLLKIDLAGFPTIRTDPTLIRRALTNLANNGIQAMPDGGTLELTAQKTEHQAIITVSDTGKGISEEVKARMFTPLVTTKAKGQGLGLAVVKRLVEALGGSIAFESQPEKGTKFTITLPIQEDANTKKL